MYATALNAAAEIKMVFLKVIVLGSLLFILYITFITTHLCEGEAAVVLKILNNISAIDCRRKFHNNLIIIISYSYSYEKFHT